MVDSFRCGFPLADDPLVLFAVSSGMRFDNGVEVF